MKESIVEPKIDEIKEPELESKQKSVETEFDLQTTIVNFPAVTEYFEVRNDDVDFEHYFKENYLATLSID